MMKIVATASSTEGSALLKADAPVLIRACLWLPEDQDERFNVVGGPTMDPGDQSEHLCAGPVSEKSRPAQPCTARAACLAGSLFEASIEFSMLWRERVAAIRTSRDNRLFRRRTPT
jgi:hypothetical protein